MNRRYLVGCLLAALALLATACEYETPIFRVAKSDVRTRRTPPAGAVIGGEGEDDSFAWLGIPYAEPPVGDLRWREPQPAKPWKGVRETLEYGPACPQFTSKVGGVTGQRGMTVGDEDCLTLNVHSPRLEAAAVAKGDARLPVMVWIHGGGNSVGTAMRYDGGHLASSQNIIVVTIQYRLGPLGWFRLAALRDGARTDAERSGNFGLLDIIQALRWVRDNIAAFGGDPNNVTVFGESAGAKNTYALLISPLAKGLFHRAIAESGGIFCSPASEAENFADAPEPGSESSAGEIALGLLEYNFHLRRTEAKQKMATMPPAALAALLRKQTPREILEITPPPKGKTIVIYPQTFDDGAVISAGCWRNFQRPDGWNRVPVIAGTTRDEARLFLFGDKRFIDTEGMLPKFVNKPLFLRTADYISKLMKAAGADKPAAAMQAAEPNVFVYRFDWDQEPTVYDVNLSKMFGAAHGMEVAFVFGRFDLGNSIANVIFTKDNAAGRLTLSNAMMSYWGQFARTGRPGRGKAGDLPEWPAFGAAQNQLILDAPAGGGIRAATSDVDESKVRADLFADKELGLAGQCGVLESRVYIGWDFSPADYGAVKECQSYPYRPRSDL